MGKYMSLDNLKYLLHEVHDVKKLFSIARFQDMDVDSLDMLLDSAKSWADKEWYPSFKEMDEKPAYFKDGKVYSHPIIKQIFKTAGENGWIGLHFDYEDGGMQVPSTVNNAVNHILESANNHLNGYLGLTTGSANLIRTFGSQELKDQYLPSMMDGSWGGTMCLTEPQAGSSLGDISTSAAPNKDGSYAIEGQKIFISGGDHQGVSNFVHLTLARIEGAPQGSKGISLFVVPTDRKEGEDFVHNDVITASDFQKMGQRGYSTVHLVFGENNNCKGWLVGEANKGLKYMFQMMNAARLDVGMTAASTASGAYYASLQYAKERPQGRRIMNDGKREKSSEQTLIINHADVRRMLFLQKAIVEGSLSLLFDVLIMEDLAHHGPEEGRSDNNLLVELLTPIAKAYPTEKGKESIDNGLQILGGYGFCTDFILQQYYRDIRIMTLYEGTTGIQALDLLGRKISMAGGKGMKLLIAQMKSTVDQAAASKTLAKYGAQMEQALVTFQKSIGHLMAFAQDGKTESYLADGNIFLDLMGIVVVGHQWLKMALISEAKLQDESSKFSANFHEGKIHTMKFYFKYELTKVNSRHQTLISDDEVTIVDEEKEYLV